jgi:hypothetical protein
MSATLSLKSLLSCRYICDELISFVGLTEVNPTKLQPDQETDLIANIMVLIEMGKKSAEFWVD